MLYTEDRPAWLSERPSGLPRIVCHWENCLKTPQTLHLDERTNAPGEPWPQLLRQPRSTIKQLCSLLHPDC